MLQWFIRFFEFAKFCEFNESSASFRENPIGSLRLCGTMPSEATVRERQVSLSDSLSLSSNVPLLLSQGDQRETAWLREMPKTCKAIFTLSASDIAYKYVYIGRSKGGARDARPSLGVQFLSFHTVSGKIWANNRLAPHLWSWHPHLINPGSATGKR